MMMMMMITMMTMKRRATVMLTDAVVRVRGTENARLENAAPNYRTGKRVKRHVWKVKLCTSHAGIALYSMSYAVYTSACS